MRGTLRDVPELHRGGSLAHLREANRGAVVDLVRRSGGMTQAEISRTTGLSPASVSNIVRALRQEDVAHVSSVHRNGRRAWMITLNPVSGLVAGVDFGNRHVRIAVADLAHNVLAERYQALAYAHRAGDGITLAAATIAALVRKAGRKRSELLAVAVGVPGPVMAGTGRLGSPAILPGWAGVDLRTELEKHLRVRTVVDNDANLGALAEGQHGAGRGFSDFAYLKVSTGIGAGLVLNGCLYRGAAGTAGEIGHTTIEEHGPVCRCGNRGCLEVLAGAPALLELLRGSHGADLSVNDLLRLSEAGDVGCRRVIADAGRHIGVAVANLSNLLSLQRIVVGGELASAGDVLLSSLRESMTRRAISIADQGTEVVLGQLAERTAVLGAVALAVQESDRFGAGTLRAIDPAGQQPVMRRLNATEGLAQAGASM
jgi:predicted NBD/HSP70 family sugar kinase